MSSELKEAQLAGLMSKALCTSAFTYGILPLERFLRHQIDVLTVYHFDHTTGALCFAIPGLAFIA